MKLKFLLIILLFSLKLVAQITYSIPIDSMRIDFMEHDGDNDDYKSLSYDTMANGRFISGSEFLFDSVFTSKPLRKRYHYDASNRKTNYEEWNILNGEVKFKVKEEIKYNSLGQIIKYKLIKPYTNEIDSLAYNSFDSVSFKLVQDIDSPSIYYKKYEYEYYPNHKLYHQLLSVKSDTGQWKIIRNYFYYYSYSAAPDTVLINDDRYLHFKDSLDRDTLVQQQKLIQGSWENRAREKYTYNTLGRLINYTNYYDSDPWSVDYVKTWTYDSLDQLLEYEKFYYGGGGNGERYTYYANGRTKSLFKYSYSTHGGGSNDYHKYSYKSLELPISIETFDFSIYPNPASGSISTLIFSSHTVHELYLYNSIGQLIKSETLEVPVGYAKIDIPISNISKGFYFLSISDGEQVKTKKVIIAE